jgi:hypothetical protein
VVDTGGRVSIVALLHRHRLSGSFPGLSHMPLSYHWASSSRYPKRCPRHVQGYPPNEAIQRYDSLPTAEKAKENPFNTILPSTLPPEEKDIKRMAQESYSVLTASGDIIVRTITKALYHLLSNPPYLAKFRQELTSVMPNPTTDVELTKLENMPYSTAVLK